jgi:hypothetical protein
MIRRRSGLFSRLEAKWIIPGMPQRVQFQVHVEIRPPQMKTVKEFDVKNRSDGRRFEPRVFQKREKQLLVINVQPEAVLRNVNDFNACRCGAVSSVR